ncbi:MAG: hypothetical protein HC788_04175 [Sphingopyxis sp.]|nr:hypothetical protein [Sphingopyxis sp.]
MRRIISALSLTTALAATGWAAPAVAQDAATDDGALVDIIVTAQRREENLQDIPLSVATVSGDTLAAVTGAARHPLAVGPRPQPQHRKLVRPHLPALLHPRPRQHRL